MADMSKKTDTQLEKIIQKDSGADAETARAAYNELTNRKGDLGFTVTMILGGRPLKNEEVPLPKPRPKNMPKKNKKTEMAYGGMAGGKKHMYAAGGMVKDNPGLKALKKASPQAYTKITSK
jgi:hypothetical protein